MSVPSVEELAADMRKELAKLLPEVDCSPETEAGKCVDAAAVLVREDLIRLEPVAEWARRCGEASRRWIEQRYLEAMADAKP